MYNKARCEEVVVNNFTRMNRSASGVRLCSLCESNPDLDFLLILIALLFNYAMKVNQAVLPRLNYYVL